MVSRKTIWWIWPVLNRTGWHRGNLILEKNEKERIVPLTFYLCFKLEVSPWLSSQWKQQCFLSPLHSPTSPPVRYNTGHVLLRFLSFTATLLLDPISYMGKVSDSVSVCMCVSSDSCLIIDLRCWKWKKKKDKRK